LSARVTAEPGLFRFERTPYLRELADRVADPYVEVISACTGTQIGKTIWQAITLGWEIDQDPGPSLWAMPTEDLAKRFATTRLQPMFLDCPSIKQHIPMSGTGKRTSKAAFKQLEINFDRMDLFIVGGNSPANLSSTPIRRLRLDELDKFPGASEKEAGLADLARERVKTFWNRKILQTSTPTLKTGEIWRAFLAGDQRYYMCPCPHCQQPQRLQWGQVKWPEECRLPKGDDDGPAWDMDRVFRETWYECEHCGDRILDRHKRQMLLDGFWEPTSAPRQAKNTSYHLNSLYSQLGDLRFGSVACQFLASKGNPGSLKNFVNSWLAEPWENGEVADEQAILAHRAEYSAGEIPQQPIAVIITADVQEDRLFYLLRAWGAYETSWLVRYGMVQTFEQLAAITREQYFGPKPKREKVQVTHGFIDANYRTEETLRFCEENSWAPLIGRDGAKLLYPARYDHGKLVVDTDHWKDNLQLKLKIPVDSPGAWLLHAETGFDYARHLTAEIRIEEQDSWGRYTRKWKRIRRENHWLDCEVYQLAAAAILGIRFQENPLQSTAPAMKRADGRPWHRR
jgi:phage terminase large subunit GpA-like protein